MSPLIGFGPALLGPLDPLKQQQRVNLLKALSNNMGAASAGGLRYKVKLRVPWGRHARQLKCIFVAFLLSYLVRRFKD